MPGDRHRKANVTEAVPMGADEMDAGIRAKKKPSTKQRPGSPTSEANKAGTGATAKKKPSR